MVKEMEKTGMLCGRSKLIGVLSLLISVLMFMGCDSSSSDQPDGQLKPDGAVALDLGLDLGIEQEDGGASAPGSRCNCDVDCLGVSDHEAVCIGGICMVKASADCSSGGSTAECPTGFQCWGLWNKMGPICFPDCASNDCSGDCDADGTCIAGPGMGCDSTCAFYCISPTLPCVPNNPGGACVAGQVCVDGQCDDTCSATVLDGYCHPGFQCTDGVCLSDSGCGTWECTQGDACQDIIAMPGSYDALSALAATEGYYMAFPSIYGFLRRDLTLLVKWAACEMKHHYPDLSPIALGDLSQADGTTPGCPDNCRHPETSHIGNDLDTAYLQTDDTNDIQIICAA